MSKNLPLYPIEPLGPIVGKCHWCGEDGYECPICNKIVCMNCSTYPIHDNITYCVHMNFKASMRTPTSLWLEAKDGT